MVLEAKSGSETGPSGATSGSSDLGGPDPATVREQLERILSSQEFLGSDRGRRFLRYVVEEALEGRADRIKAFSVAVAAFDRDENFDPQTDPIVRIEAGRLRRFLERYYLVAGAGDPVRIDIPKGAYVPTFSWLDWEPATLAGDGVSDSAVSPPESIAAHSPGTPRRSLWFKLALPGAMAAALAVALALLWLTVSPEKTSDALESGPALPQPSVAVLPFTLSGVGQPMSHLASGMASELVRELSFYSSVFVLSPQSLRRFGASPDVTVIGQETGVGFVLSGGVQHVGQRIRVAVHLNDTDTGGVVWVEAYEREFAVEDVFDLQAEIAQDVVRRIAQPEGAIALFDWKRTRGRAPETWDAYDCVVQADHLHRRLLPPHLAPEIRACLQRVVDEEPGYAEGWEMSALLALDALRYTPLALSSRKDIDAAHAAAARAVELAPDSGRAHLALMMALYFQGQVGQALAAGETAARLSPNDPHVLAEVGIRNIISGDLATGVALIQQTTRHYQGMPLLSRLALALAGLREGRYPEASNMLMSEGQDSNFVYWSVAAAVHGKAGRLEEARHAAGELLKLYPDFPTWAWVEMKARNLVPEIAMPMAEGWQAAGLPVPLSPPETAR